MSKQSPRPPLSPHKEFFGESSLSSPPEGCHLSGIVSSTYKTTQDHKPEYYFLPRPQGQASGFGGGGGPIISEDMISTRKKGIFVRLGSRVRDGFLADDSGEMEDRVTRKAVCERGEVLVPSFISISLSVPGGMGGLVGYAWDRGFCRFLDYYIERISGG